MKKEKWLIVTNKMTYLYLIAGLICIILVVIDAVRVFALNKPELINFQGDEMTLLLISGICIYLFVRFNTYSFFYNPEHPKPKYNRK